MNDIGAPWAAEQHQEEPQAALPVWFFEQK